MSGCETRSAQSVCGGLPSHLFVKCKDIHILMHKKKHFMIYKIEDICMAYKYAAYDWNYVIK